MKLILLIPFFLSIHAIAQNLVISQVYGAGGNAGATFNADYVEIFNPGNGNVSLSGWSLHYASATGTSWNKVDLSGNIGAGKFYLVQFSTPGANGSPLPTPDVVASPAIAMASASGKVVLVNHINAITGCPASYADLIGYGTANCFEGSGACSALSATLAGVRQNNACTDNNNNATDFITALPLPRNSTSAPISCSLLLITWGDITVKQLDNTVVIHWENMDASEVNYFEIQRATSVHGFVHVGKVIPHSNSFYTYEDRNASAGINHYRILAIEKNGDTSISKIIVILVVKPTELIVFPNPAGSILKIQSAIFGNDVVKIYINSVAGKNLTRVVMKSKNGQLSMNIEKLPPGIYYVSIESGSHRVLRMFVKQ